MSRPLLLLALAALLAAPGCRALSCHQCSDLMSAESTIDHPVFKALHAQTKQPCSQFDASNSTFKVDPCQSPFDQSCVKAVTNGKVIRGCYNLLLNNCTVSDQLTECFCTSDYCNAAGLTAPALLLLLPAALLALLVSRQ